VTDSADSEDGYNGWAITSVSESRSIAGVELPSDSIQGVKAFSSSSNPGDSVIVTIVGDSDSVLEKVKDTKFQIIFDGDPSPSISEKEWESVINRPQPNQSETHTVFINIESTQAKSRDVLTGDDGSMYAPAGGRFSVVQGWVFGAVTVGAYILSDYPNGQIDMELYDHPWSWSDWTLIKSAYDVTGTGEWHTLSNFYVPWNMYQFRIQFDTECAVCYKYTWND
jgi:hypothetical protein